MKMYLISDNVDTYTGMRLAGVDGVVVHERDELKKALEKVLSDPTVGIVLLTEKFGQEFPDIIDTFQRTNQETGRIRYGCRPGYCQSGFDSEQHVIDRNS